MRSLVPVLTVALAALAGPSFAADGAKIFQTQCKVCHQAKSTPVGPSLSAVAGRKIASLSDFKYSAALQGKSAQAWTDANLNAFLAGPTKFAPGTRMPVQLANPQDRAAVIAYLKTLK